MLQTLFRSGLFPGFMSRHVPNRDKCAGAWVGCYRLGCGWVLIVFALGRLAAHSVDDCLRCFVSLAQVNCGDSVGSLCWSCALGGSSLC